MNISDLFKCEVGTTHTTVSLNEHARDTDEAFVARHMEKIYKAVRIKEFYGPTPDDCMRQLNERIKVKNK